VVNTGREEFASGELTGTENPAFAPAESTDLAFMVGFFFSFRLGIVLFSVRILGTEPSGGTALSLALDLLLLVFVCFDRMGFTRNSFGSMLRTGTVRWVAVFMALSLCSLVWSETGSMLNSAAYWSGLFTDFLIMTMLLRSGSSMRVAQSLMKGFILSTCCLALVAWCMPAQSDLRLGDEEFFNTNEIGNLCAIAIFFAQYLMRRSKGRWGLVILFLGVTLLRSLSKTTLVAFLLSEAFLVIHDKSIRRKTKVLLTISAILLIFVFWRLFEAYYDIYTTTGNQAETLTGRTAIWLYVVNALFDHPWSLWIGHGFDSWWKVVPPFGGEQFEARHAENELLQQLYAYGILGVVTFVGLYGSLFRQVRKLPKSPVKVLFLSLILFVVVRGLAEADAFDFLLPIWSILLISVLCDCEMGQVSSPNESIKVLS
jgi:exopolysaccharide production protein ExoQ